MMGKERKKRHKPTKFDPVSSQPTENDEHCQGAVSNVVRMLSSTNTDERECGCGTIANLVSQTEIIPHLLKSNVIKIMAPLMLDPVHSLRCAALGALRNLSVDGGEDVCNKMVQEDVLTCLTTLLEQYEAGWLPDSGTSTQPRDLKSDIFVQAVHLLLNLCEYSETAVKIVNQHQLLPLLLSCVNPDKYDYTVCIVAAQCIYTSSESNLAAANLLASNVGILDSLVQRTPDCSDFTLLRTLVVGIVYNTVSQQEEGYHPGIVHKIIKVLGETLLQDIESLLETSLKEIKILQEQQETPEDAMDAADSTIEKMCNLPEKQSSVANKCLNDALNILEAQKVAIEMIANICYSTAADQEWEDVDSDGSMEDMREDAEVKQQNDNSEVLSRLELEAQEAICQEEIINKVLSKCHMCMIEDSAWNQLMSYSLGAKVLKRIETCSSRGMLCLVNLLSSCGAEAIGATETKDVWLKLSQFLTHHRVVQSEDLLDGVSSALRSIAEKLVEANHTQFNEVTKSDLEVLFEMGLKCNTDQIRANAISIISTIGVSLAKSVSLHPLLKDIGGFFLEVITTENQLWVVAEALDAIIDVFSDDQTNPLISELLLIKKLQNVVPVLKQRIKLERRTLGGHLPIVSTVKNNLVRFIQYKQKLLQG